MKTYFSTFITGTQEIVKELLEKRKAKIKLLLDGLVLYESNYIEREVRNFRFLNNTFVLLRDFNSLESNNKSLEKILSIVANDKNLRHKISINLPKHRKNFRIVSSLQNQTISVNRELLKKIESIILCIDGMRLNIKKPNLEFWALLRRDGYGFFGIRITYPHRDEVHREKGKLKREIAYIMSILSNPTSKDIVLDPFAGYGALPLERAQNFPYKKVIAIEKDDGLVSKLQQKIRAMKKINVLHGDALALSEIKNGSIDKIITDPPWGEYKEIPNINTFYRNMLKEFERILRIGGVVVILIGAKEIFESVLQDQFLQTFKIKNKYDILVSGKKAAIYQLIKKYEN